MRETIMPLYISEDNLVEMNGLVNSDGTYVNDATMTFSIKDSDDDVVTGAENVTMSYVSESNGQYRGVAPRTLSYKEAESYFLEITIGSNYFHRVACAAQYRRGPQWGIRSWLRRFLPTWLGRLLVPSS